MVGGKALHRPRTGGAGAREKLFNYNLLVVIVPLWRGCRNAARQRAMVDRGGFGQLGTRPRGPHSARKGGAWTQVMFPA